jgi:hypothetical protein
MRMRVWRIANEPSNSSYYPVSSEEEAIKKINELAQKDLKNEGVFWNAFGLEIYEEGWWLGEEYYNKEGEDIRQIEERLEEEKEGKKDEH